MSAAIINKVANSPLVNIDLEEWTPQGPRVVVDLALWLEQGVLLREKPFREALKQEDWKKFQEHYVAIHCTSDAILPAWAALLVTSYLQPYAKEIVLGTLADLERHLFAKVHAYNAQVWNMSSRLRTLWGRLERSCAVHANVTCV